VSDVFSFDLDDGFASGRCPICYAVDRDELRWLDSFWREGRRDPATRTAFFAARGFCPPHARRLHQRAVEAEAGAAIADVYGALADRHLAQLDAFVSSRAPTRRRGGREQLPKAARCTACVAAADALERKAHFFLKLLATPAGRARFERSAGLCYAHLETAVALTGSDADTAAYLVRDWCGRLSAVRGRLADLDRGSWTEVVRLYAGDGG
jgi:hypothetical protein